MELEGGHRNSAIKRRNPIEFGLVFNDAKERQRQRRRRARTPTNRGAAQARGAGRRRARRAGAGPSRERDMRPAAAGPAQAPAPALATPWLTATLAYNATRLNLTFDPDYELLNATAAAAGDDRDDNWFCAKWTNAQQDLFQVTI
ncbi:hypothetical protein EVAR_81290_1 [Eumeta japonica]|uniref:Uncharacterized protein n=1 Tax=Eumeta variegata TaxID=151549 RepID=A0A4C1W2M4_EUMVA|nr:hypothetical protein EVAR_81290_1 [Eumeta japonica]